VRSQRISEFQFPHWSRDVTGEIAAELAQACAYQGETSLSIADFIADHTPAQ